jgi:hypothetical protein
LRVILLLITLCISIIFHVYYLFVYVKSRDEKYLNKFINTAVINLLAAGITIIIAIFKPEEIKKIRGPLFIWFLSGVLMILTVAMQSAIFVRIYRRAKLPEHYHYNFFGRKVLHSSVVKPMEIAIFFASIPLLLVAGAYFVARLIRFFI